ncbi:putative reverse transcriptase domain-containing protein [Tanacetum coccineum]
MLINACNAVGNAMSVKCSLIPLSRGSFDVIVGMDWLSKRKFVIVCHEKVVRIPLEGDEILQVHGERTQGVVKTLMNTKVEFRIDLVHGATSVAKSPYRLAPLEMQELSEQLRELQDKEEEHGVHLKLELELLRKEKLYAKVENAPAEMTRDMDQQMEKRADDGKANVVTDALSRKKRVKPRRVRAMAMIIQYKVRGIILAAQNAAESVRDTIGFEYCLASSSGWTKSPVLWAEIGESSLTGPELVLDMTDKVVLIKEKLKAARDRQKSTADNRRKPLEFKVGDRVMLKVFPWNGVIRFGKKGKLAPRYVGPFHILERVGPVASRLRLLEELSGIKVDKTLRFIEEPVENSDREVKRLKCSRMVVVKVHLGLKRGL